MKFISIFLFFLPIVICVNMYCIVYDHIYTHLYSLSYTRLVLRFCNEGKGSKYICYMASVLILMGFLYYENDIKREQLLVRIMEQHVVHHAFEGELLHSDKLCEILNFIKSHKMKPI